MSISYPYKAWMLNKEWNVHNPYVTISGNTVTGNNWYTDFSGVTENWGDSNNVIFMDNDNTTTNIPLYYSTDEARGQLYLHPYDESITPCTSSTNYTTSYETKSGSLTVSRSSYNFFTPQSRTYPSNIGSNNYTWFCGWGTEKTGTTLEVVSPSIHSFTASNWPSSFHLNSEDTSSVINGNTNTSAYYGYQKISGSYSLYVDDGTSLSDLNDATITSATVNLQKIVCKYTPSTRNLTAGTTVSWSLADSWAINIGTETVKELSDSYTVYYADKWSGTLSVSVSVTSGLKFSTTARTFIEIMSSQTQYVGDLYAVFIVPISATVNYTYKQQVTTSSTTSSVAANAASYLEVGKDLINLKGQVELLKLETTTSNNYGYVIRKNAYFPSLTLTAQTTESVGGVPIFLFANLFYGGITHGGSSGNDRNTRSVCSYSTISKQTLYPSTNGLGQVIGYWMGISDRTVTGNSTESELLACNSADSSYANYIINNSNSYSYTGDGYSIKYTNINFQLLYSDITILNFQRKMPVLYQLIMYKPNSNKATNLFGTHSFVLKRSSLSTNNDSPVYVKRYNSSGTLVQTINAYSSSTTSFTMNKDDYLTISGMGSTSLSGPTTSTSQSATVTISSAYTGGTSVNNKDSGYSPGVAILTSSVTTAVHLAKVYISVSINSDCMSRAYITSSGTEYSNTGSSVYYAPTVTKLRTYTKTYSGWSIKYCYRTVLSYYKTSWSSVKSSYKYFGGSSSSSSTTCSGCLEDVSASVNWGDSYGETYYVQCSYESSIIKAPIIKTCTDAGSWQRYITVYNPNEVSLELFYTSNKTSSKTGANSSWTDGGHLASGATTTYTITDQSGFSDEWIIAGFRLASNYYICTTVDEDVTSGTPNVVNDNWYYTK